MHAAYSNFFSQTEQDSLNNAELEGQPAADMGIKRKAPRVEKETPEERPEKRVKPAYSKSDDKSKPKLLLEARPEWHTTPLSPLPTHPVKDTPPPRLIQELHKYADALLATENATYNTSHLAATSSHKFLSTIMASGTLEDKISALTLLVQESPLHTMKAFESLLGLAKKKSRNQALMAVAALKDLLGLGVVLPGDRKLRVFGKQPGLLSALQVKGAGKWVEGEALPAGLENAHLLLWAYEDWLKRMYFDLLQILETWCSDEVEYARSRAITYVWELLRDKPEQEENLLRLLVNKLGDTDRKIASRASYLLLQLENTHPAMKLVVTNSIEADCLFRPGQSLHAKYYAVITLNQTIMSQKEEGLANRLLGIYFSLFVQLLKPSTKEPAGAAAKPPPPKNPNQGGGGKAGKMAAKKRKAEERVDEADIQLGEKMIAQVLTGVNRAFPFADTSDPTFEKHMDTLFRVTHSSNFNTAVQALMLLQQISSTKHYGAERYYRTLYESLLDPRLAHSGKQVMYLNLVYKSLKADLDAKRVQAFVKRLLQVITMHEPAFVCGVLYLIAELESTFPSIRTMITEAEAGDEDEEEHFVDAPEDGDDSSELPQPRTIPSGHSNIYDPRKRDPTHAHAERTALWDLLPFLTHFHPSVSLFATTLLSNQATPPKPDPAKHSLMHFLDRFVYRNAKSGSKQEQKGMSIMQPLAGSGAQDMLLRPEAGSSTAQPVNSEGWWKRKVEDVGADEVFFHSYFNQIGSKKGKKGSAVASGQGRGDEDDSDEQEEAGEDEIWKAIAGSRPDVEGDMDEDDDLSLGDLESDFSASDDDGSEPGLDLGGRDGDDDDDNLEVDMDDLPDLDDGDEEAMFDSDEEVPVDVPTEKETELSQSQQKRKEKKKLKGLPTFASADDYAKLLAGGDDDDGL